MREITIAELKEQSKESYQLIDIRDEGSTVYGMIPGAICIPIKQLMENLDGCVNRIKNNVKVVIYCQRGEKSRDIAERLEEMGLDCYSLAGGCNKIALGHHYDDVIETILMGMLHGGQIQGLPDAVLMQPHGAQQLLRRGVRHNAAHLHTETRPFIQIVGDVGVAEEILLTQGLEHHSLALEFSALRGTGGGSVGDVVGNDIGAKPLNAHAGGRNIYAGKKSHPLLLNPYFCMAIFTWENSKACIWVKSW